VKVYCATSFATLSSLCLSALLCLSTTGCINFDLSGPFTVSSVTCPPAGCLPTVPITIEDKNVFTPSLRASYSLDDKSETVTENHKEHAIEFGLTTAKGSGGQSIASGQQVYLNRQIAGPQQVSSDFSLVVADMMYRWRKYYAEDSLGVELLGGLNYSTLGLDVRSPTQSASGSYDDLALQVGAGLMWRWHAGTSLQARTTYSSKGDGWGHTNEIWRSELMLAQNLSKRFTLSGGYASWRVNGQSDETSGIDATPSEFNLRFSGPTLRLDWNINAD
jgi:hypothetical protein